MFCDALLDSEASALAWSVPAFPSPDYTRERPRLASEALLWRTLVEAGVGAHFANAFLVIARKGTGPGIWPEGQLAAFYSTHRQAQFATETRVTRGGGGIQLQRRRLMGSENRAASGPLTVEARDATFVPGESVLDLMARSDDAGLSEWMKRWLALLHDNVNGGEAASIDVGPPHMIVGEDSAVSLIDQEMRYEGYDERDVMQRQLLWLGPCLTDRTPPERWDAETKRQVVIALGAMAGLDAEGKWLPMAVRREAELQALVADHRFGTNAWQVVVDRAERDLNRLLDARLEDGPLGTREDERRQAAERQLEEALAEPATAAAEAAELRDRLKVKESDLEDALRHVAEIEGSFGWRAMNRVRPIVHKLAPKGSARRRSLSGAIRAGLLVARTARKPFTQRGRSE